jgi:hypothetical protein
MNRIAERAGALGLFVTANALANAKIDPNMAPRDPRLADAPAADIKRILGQMARRGAEPKLVGALWQKLADRPLERACVAVDVLAQAIWGERDPLLPELRAAAELLGAARPAAGEVGIDLNACSAVELIERHARTPELAAANTVQLLAFAYEQHLGAFGELKHRGDDLLDKEATRESIHAFARLASLARLPTLASMYFDFLVRGLAWRVPTIDFCEALFDAGAAHKIPAAAVEVGDLTEIIQRDTAEYLLYRGHLSVGDMDTANALLMQNLAERPRWIGAPSLRIDVVRAHLGLLYGHRDVTLGRIEAACTDDALWRYAAKVRVMVAAKRAPNRAVELYHAYVAGFGNDFEGTLTVISIAPEDVKRDVARILCREAFYLPHEPAPWRLLGALFGAGDEIDAEIAARLKSQLG